MGPKSMIKRTQGAPLYDEQDASLAAQSVQSDRKVDFESYNLHRNKQGQKPQSLCHFEAHTP